MGPRVIAVLIALDLVAVHFVPRPLRGLYTATVGAAAAAGIAAWDAAGDAWNPDEEEVEVA